MLYEQRAKKLSFWDDDHWGISNALKLDFTGLSNLCSGMYQLTSVTYYAFLKKKLILWLLSVVKKVDMLGKLSKVPKFLVS